MSFKNSRKSYDFSQNQYKQQNIFLPLIKKHHLQPQNKEIGSLQKFQYQLKDMIQKSLTKNETKRNSVQKTLLRNNASQIIQISQEIQKMKNKLNLNQQKKKIYKKLDKIKLISRFKTQQQNLQKNSKNFYNQNMPQNYIPIPMYNNQYYQPHYTPYPYIHPLKYPRNYHTLQNDSDDENYKKQITKENKKKRQNQYKRYFNKDKLRKTLKKIFYVVTYTIFLKHYVKKIRKIKKQIFHQYCLGTITNQKIVVNKFYAQCCKKFFILIHKKQDVVLSILQNDSEKVRISKIKAIKILINSFLDGLEANVQHPLYNKISRFFYFICKHGSDIKNNVLTCDEIQTVCISEGLGTLRADKQMQKSQIINTLFIKILIYNVIIQPWKFDQVNFSQDKQTLKQNCLFIGSIIYYMILQIQDYYLGIKRQKWYKIGNWTENNLKIVCQQSLIYLNSEYDDGHVISGMLNEQQINSLVNIKNMREQTERMKKNINSIHLKITGYHKIIKQYALSQKKYKQNLNSTITQL